MKLISLSAVDLNLLVSFEAMFTARSVTTAAQELHIGQPAMSAALGRLRSLFEDDLFIRMGRDMQPTAKAISLAPDITTALNQIRRTLESNQTFDPAVSERVFAIAGSDYASLVILPKLLDYCYRHAPHVDLRLFSLDKNEVESLLERQNIVLAIGTFQALPRQSLQSSLMQEHFVGICRKRHPILSAAPLSLEEFAALPQALFTLRRDAVGAVDKALSQHGLTRRIVLTTPYLVTLPTIIATSDIVAVVPACIAQHFADQGAIEQFPLPLDLEPWDISMLWSKLSDQDQGCRWLQDNIQEICRELC